MLQVIIGLVGALSLAVLGFYHKVRVGKLTRANEKLAELNKLQQIQNRGLKEARDFASGALKDKNAQLAKDPRSALDEFFRVRKD